MLRGREGDCWTDEDRQRLLQEVEEWLWLYLGRGQVSSKGGHATVAQLLNMPESELQRLCAVQFLLSPVVGTALDQAAPAALRAAERSITTDESGRGLLRGRPDWARTTQERAIAGGDPSLYAYTAPRRELWRLHRLRELLQGVCDAAAAAVDGTTARSAEVDGEQWWPSSPAPTPSWHAECRRLGDAAARMLAHPRLTWRAAGRGESAQPTGDRRPAPSWWPAIEAAHALHHDLIGEPTLSSLVEVIRAHIIEPSESDLLFEVWATLATLAALDGAGWRPQTVRLMGTGREGPLACYTRARSDGGAEVIAVYAQHTPRPWRQASRYAATFQRYGLAGGMRRPDMVIERRRGEQSHWLLIEVKRTIDPTYIADSLYKVLGYLGDFADILNGTPHPHAVLLVWHMPQPIDDHSTWAGPVLVASAATYRNALRQALTLDGEASG